MRGTVTHQEIGFTLAGKGWVQVDEAIGAGFRVSCTRSLRTGRHSLCSVWAIDPAAQCRFWSPAQHVEAYFCMERQQARPRDTRWENFAEAERIIAGKRYPILTFQFSAAADKRVRDGIMVLFFPEDFPQRQRFYVLMWMDTLRGPKAAEWPAELDAVVRSFTIGPYASPGVLLGLSLETAPAEPIAPPVAAPELASKAAKATRGAASYRSECVYLDRLSPELQAHEQVSLRWILDYTAPDRYHVLQQGWDETGRVYLYDEWIDLESGHYDNGGLLWMRASRNETEDIRRRLSRALRVDSLLDLMAASAPATLSVHRYRGGRYYALTYPLEPTSQLVHFPVAYATLVEGPYSVRIWLDADTALLVKSDILGTTMKRDGQPAGVAITRVFGGWNQEFGIRAPVAANP